MNSKLFAHGRPRATDPPLWRARHSLQLEETAGGVSTSQHLGSGNQGPSRT